MGSYQPRKTGDETVANALQEAIERRLADIRTHGATMVDIASEMDVILKMVQGSEGVTDRKHLSEAIALAALRHNFEVVSFEGPAHLV